MIRSLFLYAPSLLLLQGAAGDWQGPYHQGLEQVRAGNGRKAIELLSQAVKLNPTPKVSPRYTPYFYLGLCYDSIGDEKNALTFYEKSVALKEVSSFPDDQDVLQTNLRELRENSRSFQVIVKNEGKPVTSEEKSAQKANQGTPRKNEVAEAHPPTGLPDTGNPISPETTESPKDRNVEILRQAVLDYLSGNYSSALNAALRYMDQGGRQVDKACFVAGASLFSQFLLTGEKDQSLVQAADRYLKDASPYSPPRAWISPAVLDHYRKVAQ
jgi:tetratricopeptide (TPR) repeat protein